MIVSLAIAIAGAAGKATRPFATTSAATAVAHRRTDVVTMPVVVGVVRVMVVVVVVDGLAARMVVRVIPGIIADVVRTVPAPTVVETVVIPVGRIVVGTVIVVRPPPVVAQINA